MKTQIDAAKVIAETDRLGVTVYGLPATRQALLLAMIVCELREIKERLPAAPQKLAEPFPDIPA